MRGACENGHGNKGGHRLRSATAWSLPGTSFVQGPRERGGRPETLKGRGLGRDTESVGQGNKKVSYVRLWGGGGGGEGGGGEDGVAWAFGSELVQPGDWLDSFPKQGGKREVAIF